MSNGNETMEILINLTRSLAGEVANLQNRIIEMEAKHAQEIMALQASIALAKHPELADQATLDYISNVEKEAISRINRQSKFDDLNPEGIFRNK